MVISTLLYRIGSGLAALVVIVLLLGPGETRGASLLELSQAEILAVERDLPRRTAESLAARYREEAHSAGQLADPQLVVGYENNYDMEEYLIGFRQDVPRWKNLELRRSTQNFMAEGERYRAALATKMVVREVRRAWLDLWFQAHAVRIIEHHATVLGELAEVAGERYAAGGLSQQQLLLLELEERMQRDRLLGVLENQEAARAGLARLIGSEPAARTLPEEPPELEPLLPLAALQASLPRHPAVLAAHSRIQAADSETELADQYYSGFMVDLLYGRNDRADDRFGVMLSVPLPVYPSERQDRRAAAGRHRGDATRFERDDILRSLNSEVETQYRRFLRQGERLELYRSQILPQSRLASEATTAGYQHSTEDFLSLMRAAVYELENQLNQARLQTDHAGTQANLLYYQESRP